VARGYQLEGPAVGAVSTPWPEAAATCSAVRLFTPAAMYMQPEHLVNMPVAAKKEGFM
jgi:hypothetical protein